MQSKFCLVYLIILFLEKKCKMNWIVLYEKSGKIVLTSKRDSNTGLLPRGSYLTVDMIFDK